MVSRRSGFRPSGLIWPPSIVRRYHPRQCDWLHDCQDVLRFAPTWRQDLSLAVNSAFSRSQNQLHIHVDCLRPDVRDAIAAHLDAVGASWTPFPVLLVGQAWMARRVTSADLRGVNSFLLLATPVLSARTAMRAYTLVAVDATLDGRKDYVLLAQRANLARHVLANVGGFAGPRLHPLARTAAPTSPGEPRTR